MMIFVAMELLRAFKQFCKLSASSVSFQPVLQAFSQFCKLQAVLQAFSQFCGRRVPRRLQLRTRDLPASTGGGDTSSRHEKKVLFITQCRRREDASPPVLAESLLMPTRDASPTELSTERAERLCYFRRDKFLDEKVLFCLFCAKHLAFRSKCIHILRMERIFAPIFTL